MQTIFEELSQATKVSAPTPGQTEQEFLLSILTGVSQFPEPAWLALSIPAREWYNTAAAAVSAGGACPACPGYNDAKAAPAAVVQSETPSASTDATAAPTAEPTPVSDAATAKSTEPVKDTKKRGAMLRLRELAILNQSWTPQQLLDAVKQEGFDAGINTAWTVRDEVRNVFKVCQKLGFAMVPVAEAAAMTTTK